MTEGSHAVDELIEHAIESAVGSAADRGPDQDQFASRSMNSRWLCAAARSYLQEDPTTAEDELAGLLQFLWEAKRLNASALRQSATINWEDRIRQADHLVRQAAELLVDPTYGPLDDALAEVEGQMRANQIRALLIRLADELRGTPAEELVVAYHHIEIKSQNIGTRGKAVHPASANNGLIVRELNSRLPPIDRRYSAIAAMAELAGFQITPQAVRGILLGGRT